MKVFLGRLSARTSINLDFYEKLGEAFFVAMESVGLKLGSTHINIAVEHCANIDESLPYRMHLYVYMHAKKHEESYRWIE